MEASETRGTTALVYCLIGSSLYTGTVQGWWSTPPTGLTVGRGEVHPNWSDGQQGRSQLSTLSYFTSVTCKSNSLLLIRYLFFIVTVPLELLVTDILNVTK